eukprot:TRINITY_DN83995_c0_g1_i1.p1 TRINITY_DN83995_c0_g1~~TRINITY_DN83995_c0_g1_i1.p1  ORF type:complete len:299 (+),score=98.26 TRINITY_DN83995_c0_g1_i1:70-897(+)
MPSFQFEIEYAKSNRSACKHCKEKIEKDAVRVGIKSVADIDPDADADTRKKAHTLEATRWHHEGCFQKVKGVAWFKKNLPEDGAKAVAGFEALREEDQAKVEALFAACRGESLGTPEEASTPPPAESKKRKVDGEKDASTQKRSKFFADKKPQEQAAVVPAESALSKDQLQAIEAVKADLCKKNADALKLMLAKNGLPKSGKKDELLERVSEAKALGVPPTCPTCDKVKLRFSKTTGFFSCPGFFDDDAKHFKKCQGPGKEVTDCVRTPWQELGA